ncbi:hypothetical protein BKA70DRAFT_1483288 [Coprinopsis sp. MPI-PUGE-AT-0042]|nr:hypothetical protein BKA70DRAFT_1483288 [Coprinopsis sp. MPI-PUGE-AT-0042]
MTSWGLVNSGVVRLTALEGMGEIFERWYVCENALELVGGFETADFFEFGDHAGLRFGGGRDLEDLRIFEVFNQTYLDGHISTRHLGRERDVRLGSDRSRDTVAIETPPSVVETGSITCLTLETQRDHLLDLSVHLEEGIKALGPPAKPSTINVSLESLLEIYETFGDSEACILPCPTEAKATLEALPHELPVCKNRNALVSGYEVLASLAIGLPPVPSFPPTSFGLLQASRQSLSGLRCRKRRNHSSRHFAVVIGVEEGGEEFDAVVLDVCAMKGVVDHGVRRAIRWDVSAAAIDLFDTLLSLVTLSLDPGSVEVGEDISEVVGASFDSIGVGGHPVGGIPVSAQCGVASSAFAGY